MFFSVRLHEQTEKNNAISYCISSIDHNEIGEYPCEIKLANLKKPHHSKLVPINFELFNKKRNKISQHDVNERLRVRGLGQIFRSSSWQWVCNLQFDTNSHKSSWQTVTHTGHWQVNNIHQTKNLRAMNLHLINILTLTLSSFSIAARMFNHNYYELANQRPWQQEFFSLYAFHSLLNIYTQILISDIWIDFKTNVKWLVVFHTLPHSEES